MSAISGISTSDCTPRRRASATTSKYTSVLPEPVTPSSSVTPPSPAAPPSTGGAVSVAISARAASAWGPERGSCGWSGFGGSATRSGASATVSSTPSSINPSTTLALTPASRLSARLPRTAPSAATATTLPRAGVIRLGGIPVARTPTLAVSVRPSSGRRRVMASARPFGARV